MFVTTVFIMVLVGPGPLVFLIGMSGMAGILIQRGSDLVWGKLLAKCCLIRISDLSGKHKGFVSFEKHPGKYFITLRGL